MALKILRAAKAQEMTGLPRSSFYAQISKGLLTPGIRLGERTVGWPEAEINEINCARIQGKTDEEIRNLVTRLVDARQHFGEEGKNDVR